MSANLQATTNLPKVSQNVANYSAGLRAFVPQFQNCPSRTIEGFPQYAVDNFQRIAPVDTVQTAGWCGGQLNATARMAVEQAISRPNYVMNLGSPNGDLGVASDGLPKAQYGQGAASAPSGLPLRTDTLTLAAMKNSATRYDDLTSVNGGFQAIYDNPIARANSGAEPRVCLGELSLAKAARQEQRSINLASKYTAAPAYNLELGAPDSQAYAKAFSAYLPQPNRVVIP